MASAHSFSGARVETVCGAVVLALGVTLAGAAPAGAAAAPATVDRVRDAIVSAIRDRMGDDADVRVSGLDVTGDTSFTFLQAVPEPDARTGERIVFRQIGRAHV